MGTAQSSNEILARSRACAMLLLGAAMAAIASGQDFTSLVAFTYANGAAPSAPLVQGPNGDLYGTTTYGGTCSLYDLGCGTVFKVSPAGRLTTLRTFSGPDGAFPSSGLLLDTDGNFYGTTEGGGANCGSSNGCGTLYRMTPSGDLTTLYSFCSLANCADGEEPAGPLVQAGFGDIYGTTSFGGGSVAYGTVFRITSEGALSTLHSFTDPTKGNQPTGLVESVTGEFYGTTAAGGAQGYGTVFQITSSGEFTILYNFCSQTDCADGESPSALIQATSGNFVGTAERGGDPACSQGCGTVFEITSTGIFSLFHSFTGPDGFSPGAGVTQAADGNFYGTTVEGGYSFQCPGGCGTIFELTNGGTFTTLYDMSAFAVASDPRAALFQAANGILYGSTVVGGYDGAGTLFAMNSRLAPYVITVPHAGIVGEPVKILGYGLKQATGVSFNGTPAQFTIISGTEISTTVPAGAKGGSVEVTTPHGVLYSFPFIVGP